MSHGRILVVDDNALSVKLSKLLLMTAGYVVETASSAEEAIRVLTSFSPQLVLMDLQLPGVDGFELTTRLKANPATRDIVVVALTAYAMKGDEHRARAAGCDGYITKPIDTRTFVARISEFLRSAPTAATD